MGAQLHTSYLACQGQRSCRERVKEVLNQSTCLVPVQVTGAVKEVGTTPLEKYEHQLDVISAGCITPSGMEEDYRWACRLILQACAALHRPSCCSLSFKNTLLQGCLPISGKFLHGPSANSAASTGFICMQCSSVSGRA